jgi:hypothetical protein
VLDPENSVGMGSARWRVLNARLVENGIVRTFGF